MRKLRKFFTFNDHEGGRLVLYVQKPRVPKRPLSDKLLDYLLIMALFGTLVGFPSYIHWVIKP
jgi:hypothetical protein